MTEQQLIDLVIADGVCGGRVYPVEAPKAVNAPYAVYDVIRTRTSAELNGDCGYDNRYMFTCWCSGYEEAKTTIEAFRTSLNDSAYEAGSPLIGLDPDDETLYRIVNLDFRIIE